jgi:site-specific DNA-adenine methylase
MTKLKPFFSFYGGKYRATRHYPVPEHDVIVEPFAGSAGYSLNYSDRRVILRDLDPVIAGTWSYLISADPEEIYSLPDLEAGQTSNDLDVPEAARWLIGWWLNHGTAAPSKSPSSWMRRGEHDSSFWGEQIRERIASQVPFIRHWTVQTGPYFEADDVEATWFVDPPYQKAGKHYRHGSKSIDFSHLGEWCKTRQGQLIVCENEGADWLPFRPLASIKSTVGRQKEGRYSAEVIYP